LRSRAEQAAVINAGVLNEQRVSWRVFPALLSDLANHLFPDMPEPDARQLFMKKCVVPLSAKIATLVETRLAAAAAAEAELIHQHEEAIAAALLQSSIDAGEGSMRPLLTTWLEQRRLPAKR
jgi:hypothetical protein